MTRDPRHPPAVSQARPAIPGPHETGGPSQPVAPTAGTFNPNHIHQYLQGLKYPADREAVIACARRNGVGRPLRFALEHLPEQLYATPVDVATALNQQA